MVLGLKRISKYIPLALAFLSFLYFLRILIQYGDLLNPDDCAYVAFWKEMIRGDIYFEWTTPKPFEIILFGILYQITHSLFIVALVFAVAMSLLVYYSSKVLIHISGNQIPCLFFTLFICTSPFFVDTVATGGSGLVSSLLVIIALSEILTKKVFLQRLGNKFVIVFLSLSGLSRPENWINAFLIIFCLYLLKYLRKQRGRIQYSDLFLLIPLLMPIAWHIFDYLAFGDLFYSTKMTVGYAENVRDAFGWSDSFIGSDYPKRLKSFMFETLWLRVLLLSLVGLIWMLIKNRKSNRIVLLLLFCSFFGNIVFYFVTYIREMALIGRFFFYNFVLIILLASVGAGGIVESVGWIFTKALRDTVRLTHRVFAKAKKTFPSIKDHYIESIRRLIRWVPLKAIIIFIQVGIVSTLILFFIFIPLRKSLLPLFPGLKGQQTMRKLVEESVRIIQADKDYSEDSFLLVIAEYEGRYCILVPNKGSHVYPYRQLAALVEVPMFNKNLFYLMHFLTLNRQKYAYRPVGMLMDLKENIAFEKNIFYLVRMYPPRSDRIRMVIENLKKQAKSTETLIDRDNFKIYKLKE